MVRSLVNKVQSSGNYTKAWDGKNNFGKQIASGIYYIKMKTANQNFVHKAMLIK